MRLSLIVLLLFFCHLGNAQGEINYYLGNQKHSFPLDTKFWVDTSNTFTLEHFIQNQEQFSSSLPSQVSNLPGKIWIIIPIDSITSSKNPYAIITNPHINFLKAWWLNEDKQLIKESNLTGDHLAFNTREIISPCFTFLNPDVAQSKYLLLAIDKRKEILVLNIHLAQHGFIENRLTQETILCGWLFGIVAVILIISLVLYFFVKERIYLLYAVFLFVMLCYSISDFGFLHWILTFKQPRNLDFVRPVALAVAFLFYVLFILNTLRIKEKSPKSYRAIKFALISFAVYVAVTLSLYSIFGNELINYYAVIGSHLFQRILLIILIFIVIQAAISRTPFALLIGISLILFLGVHFINYYFENGTLPDKLIYQHFLPIVYTFDCLIMSIIIAQTFLSFQKKSLDLSNELLLQRLDFTNKLNEVKEKDLTRISQYLHDNIGAEISAMRYELEALKNNPNPSEALDRIIAKSSFIANEVRNASHNLSPLMLERFGLKESVSQFLTQINKTTSCNFQLDVIGEIDEIDKSLNIVLFQIIQECIQNILKHSQAKNTIIQILNEPKTILLFIEDDGIGFDPMSVKYGLGLDSIKKLIEFKQGVFRIVSEKTKGVKIYVELPNQSN
jgi:signal transduction histidine kinase